MNTGGKTRFLAAALVLFLLGTACRPSVEENGMPAQVTCRVHVEDAHAWRNWARVHAPSGILGGGLIADENKLWIATGYGPARLDLETWECELWPYGAGRSLAGALPILPDGEGGAWAGARDTIVHFDGKTWETFYEIPSAHLHQIAMLGLDTRGNVCAVTQGRSRFPTYYLFCPQHEEESGTLYLPPHSPDCDSWQRFSDWSYAYLTPEACAQTQQVGNRNYRLLSVSQDGREMWAVRSDVGGRRFLLQWQENTVRWAGSPFSSVTALAVDEVQGGAWMLAGGRLRYVRMEGSDGGQTAPVVPYATSPLSPLAGPSTVEPGRIISRQLVLRNVTAPIGPVGRLVVDTSGQVWAIDGSAVLRYDEEHEGWERLFSLRYQIDALAADPLDGVWVAGETQLVYLNGDITRTWNVPYESFGQPTALVVDREGRVWVGTLYHGVWMAEPLLHTENAVLDWRRYGVEDGLPDERITAMLLSQDGHLYAAHYEGVSYLDTRAADDGTWATLPGSGAEGGWGWANALVLEPLPEGERLWVGYHRARVLLRRYEGGVGRDMALAGERTPDSIGALMVDGDGILWAGTDEGLWRRSPGEAGRASSWEEWGRIGHHDLLTRDVFTLARDAHGRMWVGGREGLAMRSQPYP